jgi:26S proteasome regulatory subunit N5
LELCKHWLSIFNTNTVQAKDETWINALQHATIFVVLASFSNLQNDLLHKLANEKRLEKLPEYYNLVKKFTTKEIIGFPLLLNLAQDEILKNHVIFKQPERGQEWQKDFHTRVTEHNIRVVSQHYERIRLPHLAKMIGLSEDVSSFFH